MRVINNKIYIKQGETAEYIARVANREGVPYYITYPKDPSGETYDTMDFRVQFIVRPSSYAVGTDKNINHYLELDDTFIFDDGELKDIEGRTIDDEPWDGTDWSELAPPEDEEELKRLYRIKDGNDPAGYHYGYYVYGAQPHWEEYFFEIGTMLMRDETAALEAKKYNYEIVLLGGIFDNEEYKFTEIYYKEPLLDLTEFVVEGSISD